MACNCGRKAKRTGGNVNATSVRMTPATASAVQKAQALQSGTLPKAPTGAVVNSGRTTV